MAGATHFGNGRTEPHGLSPEKSKAYTRSEAGRPVVDPEKSADTLPRRAEGRGGSIEWSGANLSIRPKYYSFNMYSSGFVA
jgi:hypothetical protein